jgi:hypothetical protein
MSSSTLLDRRGRLAPLHTLVSKNLEKTWQQASLKSAITDLGGDELILKWISDKQSQTTWTESIWPRWRAPENTVIKSQLETSGSQGGEKCRLTALMMEAINTSETSSTRLYIAKFEKAVCHLQPRSSTQRGNLMTSNSGRTLLPGIIPKSRAGLRARRR